MTIINNKYFTIAIPTFRAIENVVMVLSKLNDRELIGEVIVIIDNDEEQDVKILYKYKVIFHNFVIIRNRIKIGVSASRNVAIGAAKYPYILSLDDDVEPLPHLVREHLWIYQNRPDAVGVAGNVILYNEIGKEYLKNNPLFRPYSISQETKRVTWGVTANLSVTNVHAKKVSFNENLPNTGGGEDVLFGFKLTQHGNIYAHQKASVKHKYWKSKQDVLERCYRWGKNEGILMDEILKDKYLSKKFLLKGFSFNSLTSVNILICCLIGTLVSLQSALILVALLAILLYYIGILTYILSCKGGTISGSLFSLLSVLVYQIGALKSLSKKPHRFTYNIRYF